MGGSNDPSNIKLVTIEEHAEEHRLLYEKHGKWQDFVAWKMLSGWMTAPEASFIKRRMGALKGSEVAAKSGKAHRGGRAARDRKVGIHDPSLNLKSKGGKASVANTVRKMTTECYRWMNDGEKQKRIPQASVDDLIGLGWSMGRLSHTEETRNKIRAAQKGRVFTIEHRKKISDARRRDK